MQKKLEAQKVCYLPQINESTALISVVQETMERSQNVAKECNRKTMSLLMT